MASIDQISTTMTAPNSKKGFFDLPRELRDKIYDLALEHDRATSQDNGTMHLHVRAPEPRLRLVSRQFALEYYERSPPKDEICLSVTGCSPSKHLPSAGDFTYAAQASTVNVTLAYDPFDDSLFNYVDPLSTWLFELVTDMPCIKALHLRLCCNVLPDVLVIEWFSRTVHRAIRYLPAKLELLQWETRETKPIISLYKVDVMVVLPKVSSDDATSTGAELGKIGSWTHARGYEVDAGFAELRRKYGGS